MTVEVLGGRVNNDIGTQLQRILQSRGGKGVVANNLDILAVCVSNFSDSGDIGYFKVGVCGGLKVNAAGVGLKVRLDSLKVGGVDEIDLNTVAAHAVIKQCKGAAVQGAVGNDMLACTCDGPQCGRDRTHARCSCNTSLAAFKSGNLAFKHRGGGITQTGVDVTSFLTGKAMAALFAAIEYEGRGLVDGSSQSTVLGVLDIACVNGLSAKAELFVIHCFSS